MKKVFKVIVTMIVVMPLLTAMTCVKPPPVQDDGEDKCEIACMVWVNYVDQSGAKIPFGTESYPDGVYYIRAEKWKDVTTGKNLESHNYAGHDYPAGERFKDLAHGWFAAASARDSVAHPKIKGKILSLFTTGIYPDKSIEDDIEVELHYNTPDNAYIKTIKVNGEMKWDRSSFADGKVPEHIIVDLYLDINRLNK